MKEYVVETIGLTKQYPHQKAVRHLNMKVEKGAIYGFIGRNGAGKTTTLKMLCGLSKPSEGELHLFQDQYPMHTYRRIGALIEHAGLYPNLSASDHMKLKAMGMGLHDESQIEELLTLFQLHHTGKKTVKHFSLGMKQRLGIAMALLGQPDLLLLDEPINGLDPEGIREIRNTLRKLNEEKGMTIIISSHILEELDKLATHYGIIKDGELIEQISARELIEKCKNYLAIRVDDVKKASVILEQELHIHAYEIMADGELHVFDEHRNAQINTVLQQRGIHISSLYERKQDLESYFLNKIGGNLHD